MFQNVFVFACNRGSGAVCTIAPSCLRLGAIVQMAPESHLRQFRQADLHNDLLLWQKRNKTQKNPFFCNDLLTSQNQSIFSFAKATNHSAGQSTSNCLGNLLDKSPFCSARTNGRFPTQDETAVIANRAFREYEAPPRPGTDLPVRSPAPRMTNGPSQPPPPPAPTAVSGTRHTFMTPTTTAALAVSSSSGERSTDSPPSDQENVRLHANVELKRKCFNVCS